MKRDGRTEGSLDDANLCSCSVQTRECTPIIDNETGANDV
jgi:hypothetical protein